MENITIGQIVATIGVISVISGFIGGIIVAISKWWKAKVTDKFTSINNRVDGMDKRLVFVEKKREEYEKEVEKSKEERMILLRGELAALKGLKEMGCNDAVTHSINEIEDYMMEKSHD